MTHNGFRAPARWVRVAVALLVPLLGVASVAGCTGNRQGSPSARPSVARTGPDGLPIPVATRQWAAGTKKRVVSTTGEPYLRASIYGVYRQGNQASLRIGVTLVGGHTKGTGSREQLFYVGRPFSDGGHDESYLAATGLTLVDPSAQKAYLVARDAAGECLCSKSNWVVGGSNTLAGAEFAAPPAGVSTIDVLLPRFGIVAGVPVTDGPVPETLARPDPSRTRRVPGRPIPPLFASEYDSEGPAVTRPVVDIDTPIANLDESVTRKKDRVVLAADVLFAFDKATLTRAARSRIAAAARILRQQATGTVQVNGHTDSLGSPGYNQKLSERRAAAVRAELARQLRGSGLTLVARGYGEASPVAPNTVRGRDNPEGRAANRRVETVYRHKAGSSPRPSVDDALEKQSSRPGVQASRDIRVGGHVVTVEVYRIRRHGPFATLEFGMKAKRAPYIWVKDQFDDYNLFGGATGVKLIDRPGGDRYLPARFDGYCMCTSGAGNWIVNQGQTVTYFVTYAAPPAGVRYVDVKTPNFGTFKHVRVD